MRRTNIVITFCLCCLTLYAQKVTQVANKPIKAAFADLDTLMKDQIHDQVKLVGIGDVATLAKESQQFNVNLSAWLVSKKNVRNIFISADEWALRPLNDHLTNGLPSDTVLLDSLLKVCLDGETQYRTTTFRSFLSWLKNYNLDHQQTVVGLYGMGSNLRIPSSYFLSAYIYPVDKATAAKLARKWDLEEYVDAKCFDDIALWCKQNDRPGIAPSKKALIKNCLADLAHNKAVFSINSMTQQVPLDTADKNASYVITKIIERAGRSILFGLNTTVIKSDYQNEFIAHNRLMPTTGKLLHSKLSDRYYACAMDVSDSARLYMADTRTMNISLHTVAGGPATRELSLKKDHYFSGTDPKALQRYVPVCIPFVNARRTDLIADAQLISVDALFILKSLSQGKYISE